MRANGLQVYGAPGYNALFNMLFMRRFDYFPRSAEEIWAEAERWTESGISVEPGLALYYPTASYFFVNKDNTALAEVLERGFEAAIADGSFERLFAETFRAILPRLKGRLIFALRNPLLPAETPLGRKELWFRPSK